MPSSIPDAVDAIGGGVEVVSGSGALKDDPGVICEPVVGKPGGVNGGLVTTGGIPGGGVSVLLSASAAIAARAKAVTDAAMTAEHLKVEIIESCGKLLRCCSNKYMPVSRAKCRVLHREF
jgi:hypothetical protein